ENDSNENDYLCGRYGGGAKPCSAARADNADALSKEAGTLSDKFAGLARVMAGKYDWKPGEGVRSVGDVFNLIVTENGLLAATLTGAGEGRGGWRGAQAIEPEKREEAMKTSYANLQKAVE